jgi:hypothetical protein
MSAFSSERKDTPATLTITKFGSFTANFEKLPPAIPPEYLATLFTVVVTALVGSWLTPTVIGWRKAKKQGRIAVFNKKRYASPKVSLDLHDNDFSNTNLNGANLSEVNLIDANLKEANLEYTNLFGASLMRADLSRTNLHYAVLKYANLEKAKLQHSNLEYAYLDRAYLQYADLSNASLKYASIECADIRYADINGTIFLENFRLPISKEEARSRGAII